MSQPTGRPIVVPTHRSQDPRQHGHPTRSTQLSRQRTPRKEAEGESWWWTQAQKLGFSCSSPVDVGAYDCRINPVRGTLEDPSKDGTRWCSTSASKPDRHLNLAIVSQLNCHTASTDLAVCCAPEDLPVKFSLFVPCMVCATRPACIVEVPCGHVNVCADCHRDYHTNTRCLRCRERVPVRIDIGNFLDEAGKPEECKMCRNALVNVVMLPCIHMGFCEGCLPRNVVGCPTCGERVGQQCVVQWVGGTLASAKGGTAVSSLSARTAKPPAQQAGDGLTRETQDVDQEIARLEAAMANLLQSRGNSTASSSGDRPPAPKPAAHLPNPGAPAASVEAAVPKEVEDSAVK